MSATPALKTDTSSGRVGRVTIANTYPISGPLGVTPSAQIPVDGSDDAFQQPSSGTVSASGFPGRVVAVGPTPGDYSGSSQLFDSVLVRQSGVGTVTFPKNPWDGMRVSVCDVAGTCAASGSHITVVAATPGSQSIQNPYNLNSTTALLPVLLFIPYQCVEWAWDQTTSTWLVVNDNMAGVLPIITGNPSGASNIVGKGWVKFSPSGAITLSLPSNPTEGMIVRVSDISGGAAAHNITINATGGWSIEVLTLGGPGGSAVIATNNQSATWAADVVNNVWRLVAINGPHA